MQFAQIHLIYVLWLIIVLALFLFYRFQIYKTLLNRFAESKLLKEITDIGQVNRKRRNLILIVTVFVFGVLALMRPQWGFEWQEVKREGIDILLAIDTSKSMLTQDVRPNRLERTKLAVQDLVRKLKGDRIGLIAFAGDAFLVCPLTVDYSGFLLSLNDLDTQTVARGGTNIEAAIREAEKSYAKSNQKYKVLVIITDGDNLEGDPVGAAKKAQKDGVKIFTIGIGTREGELIQITDENNQRTFLKDEQGNYVKSRLNEKILEDIALSTEGVYVRASGAQFGLDTLYEQQLSRLEKHEFQSKMQKKYFERFQIPLSIAFILLLSETVLGLKRK
jgi:Ca-activated chloride channel family protein